MNRIRNLAPLFGLIVLFGSAATARAGSSAAPTLLGTEDLAGAVEVLAETVEEAKPGARFHSIALAFSGMFVADFDTRLRIDANPVDLGTEIDMEDLLGLDDEAGVWRIDFRYRFNRRHMITAHYFRIRRAGERTLERDIEIGGEEFPVGTTVETDLETNLTKLNYWYHPLYGDRWEFGIGLGVYWMGFKVDFRGKLKTPPGLENPSYDTSARVDFPPPLIGIRGGYALTDRIRLEGVAEALYVPIQNYTGWIVNVRLGAKWDVLDFAGVSLAYEYFNMGVEAHYTLLDAKFQFEYHALLAGIYLYF